MEIILSSELEKIIEYKIISGGYQNASEFIREAILRTVEHDQLKLSKLNEAVSIGIEQAERGEFSKRSVRDIIKDNETGINDLRSAKVRLSMKIFTLMALCSQ